MSICDKVVLKWDGIKNNLIVIHSRLFECSILSVDIAEFPTTTLKSNFIVVLRINSKNPGSFISDRSIHIREELGLTVHPIVHVTASEGEHAEHGTEVGTGDTDESVNETGEWGSEVFARIHTGPAKDGFSSDG